MGAAPSCHLLTVSHNAGSLIPAMEDESAPKRLKTAGATVAQALEGEVGQPVEPARQVPGPFVEQPQGAWQNDGPDDRRIEDESNSHAEPHLLELDELPVGKASEDDDDDEGSSGDESGSRGHRLGRVGRSRGHRASPSLSGARTIVHALGQTVDQPAEAGQVSGDLSSVRVVVKTVAATGHLSNRIRRLAELRIAALPAKRQIASTLRIASRIRSVPSLSET